MFGAQSTKMLKDLIIWSPSGKSNMTAASQINYNAENKSKSKEFSHNFAFLRDMYV